jgi:CRP-like cAMP-binding protein
VVDRRSLVATSAWGRALPAEAIERVAGAIIERMIEPGGYACRKGDPITHWMGVVDGLLKMSGAAPTGKTVTFAGTAPGGWFGEGSLLKDEVWKYDAIAIRQSRVACLPKAEFMCLLETSIPFNLFLLEQLNERLAHFIGLVEFDRLLDPDARVRSLIAGSAVIMSGSACAVRRQQRPPAPAPPAPPIHPSARTAWRRCGPGLRRSTLPS